MEAVIITGLSGGGKSQAAHCLEDAGYYCVDNMPPALMGQFLDLVKSGRKPIEKLAFVVDARGGNFFGDLNKSLEKFAAEGVEYRILFLEANDAVLIKRFQESRRVHPMGSGEGLVGDIRIEREKLSAIRQSADYIIDTSNMKTANLYEEVLRVLGGGEIEEEKSFSITIESFGYKYGILQDADWVLDARFLPNPYYVPSLKRLTGKNRRVREYVMRSYEAKDFVARVCGIVSDIVPSYMHEGKYSLVIGVGCTGGQHRSVAIAGEIASTLQAMGKQVVLLHRDLK